MGQVAPSALRGRINVLDPYPLTGYRKCMRKLEIQSAVEQVAGYLKEGVAAGVWRGEMPGVVALAAELGVNHKTVEAALSLLVSRGVLINQGPRRPRRIARMTGAEVRRSMRIGLLMHDVTDMHSKLDVEIRHLLHESGHMTFVAKRRLDDIGMDASKVAELVAKNPADAWLAMAASYEVLEWFSREKQPIFALFGRFRRLPVAGAAPDKTGAYAEAVLTLVKHGHRRIVLLTRPQHRLPVPSQAVKSFLETMARQGIRVSDYHYPVWANTREGFQQCLESLFRGTPPTALLVQGAVLFGAVQQFLEARGIRVPGDVSLVCTDADPSFVWRIPTVAHIQWDNRPVIRRVVQWANHLAICKDDRRQLLTKAEFVPGGTIGPVAARFKSVR